MLLILVLASFQFLQGVLGTADTSVADGMLDVLKWMRKYVSWLNGNDPRLGAGDYIDFYLVHQYDPNVVDDTFYMDVDVYTASGAVPLGYAGDREHLLGEHTLMGYTGQAVYETLLGMTRSIYHSGGYWESEPMFASKYRQVPCTNSSKMVNMGGCY